MPSLRSASCGEVPAISSAQGTSRCMIAASALFVQTSADLMATPTSGLGGMIEKPMKYDLVPCDVTSGSRAVRAHEARKTTRAAREKRADFTGYQYVFRLPGETAEGGGVAGVWVTYP